MRAPRRSVLVLTGTASESIRPSNSASSCAANSSTGPPCERTTQSLPAGVPRSATSSGFFMSRFLPAVVMITFRDGCTTAMPSPNEILNELKKIKYPGFTRDIVSFGLVKDIEVGHSSVTVFLGPVSGNPDVVKTITEEVKKTVAAIPGVPGVEVQVEAAQPA